VPRRRLACSQEVYERAGYATTSAALRAKGPEYDLVVSGLSYQLAPRAKIFRRDAGALVRACAHPVVQKGFDRCNALGLRCCNVLTQRHCLWCVDCATGAQGRSTPWQTWLGCCAPTSGATTRTPRCGVYRHQYLQQQQVIGDTMSHRFVAVCT
jgi:hypothetical protein